MKNSIEQARDWLGVVAKYPTEVKRLAILLDIVKLQARLDEHNHFFSVMHAERIAELRAELESK